MLEKDKNCIEFSMHSMMATHKPYQEDTEIAITGMAPGKSLLLANNPFDIPCDVVVVSKRYFERLQADNQYYRELAKQREENYNLLLKKTGFDTTEELVTYLDSEAQCDTLCDAWKVINSKLEAYKKENEELKKKLHEYDPLPEFREILKKLYSTNDIENLEWTLNHVCGGRGSVNGWIALSLFWKQKYETISKLVGFVTVEEIQDYLTNEANCDTLHEAISNLHDEVKYTSDEWKDMDKKLKECEKDYISAVTKAEALDKENEELKKKLQEVDVTLALSFFWKDKCKTLSNTLTTWKYATGCKAPEYAKELIADKQRHIVALRDQLNLSKTKNDGLREEIEVYSRALKEWKEGTGCPSPSAAKTLIDSMYTPLRESYRAMRKEIDQTIDEWQKATGRISPEEAKQYIDRLKTRLNKIHDCAVDW